MQENMSVFCTTSKLHNEMWYYTILIFVALAAIGTQVFFTIVTLSDHLVEVMEFVWLIIYILWINSKLISLNTEIIQK